MESQGRCEMSMFSFPRGVKYAINEGHGLRFVTFADIKAERIAKQRRHLNRVLATTSTQRRACLIWTFFVPGVIYGGWHLYIRTIEESLWLHPRLGARDLSEGLTLDIMRMFPCRFLPILQNFEAWKEAFARQHTYGRKRGGKVQGIVFGWTDLQAGDPCPRNFEVSR